VSKDVRSVVIFRSHKESVNNKLSNTDLAYILEEQIVLLQMI